MALRQVAVSLISSSTLLTSGMHIGYSAVAVPLLDCEEDYLTVEERSWFASIGTIATIVGCLMCGPILDKLGRKWTLLSVNVPFIIGWTIIWTCPSPPPVPLLYVGRLLTGLGGGMVSIPANVYIAEMATKSMRSMLVAWPSIAITLGITLVYCFGWVIDSNWRVVAAVCLTCPILTSLLVFFTLKESPTWLAAKGRLKEAEESLKWIRNVKDGNVMPEEVRDEYLTILKNTQTKQRSDVENKVHGSIGENLEDENYCGKFKQLKLLTNPDTWKPLLILNSYFFFMQFAGVNVVTAYTVNIMEDAGINMLVDPYLVTFLLGVVQLICGAVATIILNRFGRRPMSMLSSTGMTVCMVTLGAYMQLVTDEEQSKDLSWIPLFLLMAYTITSAAGFRLIPWAMIGELYPTRVRGLAGGITTCFAYLFGFIVVKFYPEFVALLGGDASEDASEIKTTPGVFYLYGGVSLIGTMFVYFFLPETLHKTLEEIRRTFLPQGERVETETEE